VTGGAPDGGDERTPVELRIEIDSDGRVVLTDLPADLIELVRKLDPDAVLSCDVPPDAPPDEEDDQARQTS
jgi:hypothetical protein